MPNGIRWPVKMKERPSGLYFDEGWANFVYRVHLQNDDSLNLIYFGGGVFHIDRYNFMSGCIPTHDLESRMIRNEFWVAHIAKDGHQFEVLFTIQYRTWEMPVTKQNDSSIVHGGWLRFIRDNEKLVVVVCSSLWMLESSTSVLR
ncbi:hypothetical protein SASPL_141340 [Salvia splendens]|uniref:TF-B3 domain-containing protein n=1 Tax=Salvia splendens TaxID=180675 RepID=A0A8X8WQD4_SALSN|nr:hypothetical protein SASPL_141340 [Salvia splendens]